MNRMFAALCLVLTVGSGAWAQDELAAVNKPAPMFRLPVYNAKPVGSTLRGGVGQVRRP